VVVIAVSGFDLAATLLPQTTIAVHSNHTIKECIEDDD